jgi:catechol 2,3-dioxygenase-like lactoylglutathione lyase family enzyme
MAAAVRAGCLFRIVFDDRQSLGECFLAGVADKLIVGHTDLPRSLNAYQRILGRCLEQVQLSPYALPASKFNVHCWRMTPTIEKISAITLRVMNMKASVEFYRDVLGMKLLYGGERASFSSLRASDSASAILNLEQGDSMPQWGRLIFHVTDVDAFWTHLREKGCDPETPRDASWGERYFHMLDPDGHELSFARPLQ